MPETILVTGSSRGIGRAIALRLARAGYDLVLHCRARRDEAEVVSAAVQALGRNARILQFDIADRASCAAALEADVASDCQPLDGLVAAMLAACPAIHSLRRVRLMNPGPLTSTLLQTSATSRWRTIPSATSRGARPSRLASARATLAW